MDHFSKESDSRFENKGQQSGCGVDPPSKGLWIGNLSRNISGSALWELCRRFGDMDHMAFDPGQSYAFVNYMKEEDAVDAFRGLQGVVFEGVPLHIKFVKGNEESPRYNDKRCSIKLDGSSLSRDIKPFHPCPEKTFDNSKGTENSDPCEILQIEFPPSVTVDELNLWRVFSPFGAIQMVTTFPGRTYAFVRYKCLVAACRAKEALHGKLFNNPDIHIYFARSEVAAELRRSGSAIKAFHGERKFDSPNAGFHVASPQNFSSFQRKSEDAGDIGGLHLRSGAGSSSGHIRLQEPDSQRRMSEDVPEPYSPTKPGIGLFHDLPFDRRQKHPFSNDTEVAKDDTYHHTVKKLNAASFLDQKLPEYTYSEFKQQKAIIVQPNSFPNLLAPRSSIQGESDYAECGYDPDFPGNLPHSHAEIDHNYWKPSDAINAGPALQSLADKSLQMKPSLSEEWKWEGTITKCGIPACHVRCFPVGRVLDFMLPEFLDCTAMMRLDVLAKYYNKAMSSWVVFFVPVTDSDFFSYNKFRKFLIGKQQAAVGALGEQMTLFIVPPSEFSENVLKVPGKVSISGVILMDLRPNFVFGSSAKSLEPMEPGLPSLRSNFCYSSSGHSRAAGSSPSPLARPGVNVTFLGPFSPRSQPDFHKELRNSQPQHPNHPDLQSSWSNEYSPDDPLIFPLPINRQLSQQRLEEKLQTVNPQIAQEPASDEYSPDDPLIFPLPPTVDPPQQRVNEETQPTDPQIATKTTSNIYMPGKPLIIRFPPRQASSSAKNTSITPTNKS
ncbi:hypothetical protein J5N97_008087 [Dioscorea zingiberensis]|uniref:RRM domain-containing protein n=1 Tax=Dioscorea zingiberensis TaxID=325984 RepID=A0A9D5HVK0_9LILI|nr:hypothetical protein J5N97_008087 [Dioscorea zingiberensis]